MPALPQVAMPFVRLIYQFWLSHGISKVELDAILKMDIENEKLAKFGISSDQLAAMHQIAIEDSGDLALGIKLGKHVAEADLTIANVLLKAESLEQGIRAMMEHSRVISESGYFTFDVSAENNYCLKFIPYEGIVFTSHQQNMVFAAIAHWIDTSFPNSKASIKYHYDMNIADLEAYQSLMACELVKNTQVFIEISEELLFAKNNQFDDSVYQQSLKQCQKVLVKRNQRLELFDEVGKAIKKCLLERRASQENVASQLNLSVRNLQRRLKEVGTSYQVILDDSREELAMSLLKDSTIPLYEVAFLVGFTEPSAFYKAFRRWTGKRPGDFRQDAESQNTNQISEASNADVSPC